MEIKISINNEKIRYDVYQMFNIFFNFQEIKFVDNGADYKINIDEENISLIYKEKKYSKKLIEENKKESLKRFLFSSLYEITGDKYPWGTLVGIRPSKLALTMLKNGKSEDEIIEYYSENYCATEEKARLCIEVAKYEEEFVNTKQKVVSIYIGMPFCPTRCLYCSFASNPISGCKKLVEPYLDALKHEVKMISKYIQERNLIIETVYFGGGTPTSINNEQFEELMKVIFSAFIDGKNIKEFTVECGRPDSITEEKLKTMKNYMVSRISINPQSMNEKTLKEIGRNHSVEDVKEKFLLARGMDFDNINMDIIVGLPKEDYEDIYATCESVYSLKPDSITVHGLSIKRASRLYENLVQKQTIQIPNQEVLNKMYSETKGLAEKLNMHPYYMYRQKNMVGNMENIGYSSVGKECIYNIQMIEDRQTIIALGADAVSKVVFMEENRIERFGNVKDVNEYVNRIEEMIEGKIRLLDTLYTKS